MLQRIFAAVPVRDAQKKFRLWLFEEQKKTLTKLSEQWKLIFKNTPNTNVIDIESLRCRKYKIIQVKIGFFQPIWPHTNTHSHTEFQMP